MQTRKILLGMGCFWGAERRFWQQAGVVATRVGYAGGWLDAPSYQQVCGGETGHAEVVEVSYDEQMIMLNALLAVFWEAHDPTQGMRQGNDIGSQYRSIILTYDEDQQREAWETRDHYQQRLFEAGMGSITTEIAMAGNFYPAEPYHQRYLEHNPNGYCGLRGTGIRFSDG